jgi:hypothetical protein
MKVIENQGSAGGGKNAGEAATVQVPMEMAAKKRRAGKMGLRSDWAAKRLPRR